MYDNMQVCKESNVGVKVVVPILVWCTIIVIEAESFLAAKRAH